MKNARNRTSVPDTEWCNLVEYAAGKCLGDCAKILLHAIHTYLDAAILAYTQ